MYIDFPVVARRLKRRKKWIFVNSEHLSFVAVWIKILDTDEGAFAMTEGILWRISAVVAPGKQWINESFIFILRTKESPTRSVVMVGLGAGVGD